MCVKSDFDDEAEQGQQKLEARIAKVFFLQLYNAPALFREAIAAGPYREFVSWDIVCKFSECPRRPVRSPCGNDREASARCEEGTMKF